MSSAEVVADWALISKDPAAGIGYSVLKMSTAGIDFGAISGDYEAGAPSSTATPDAPDAPPWVTFGPGDGGRAGVLISVSVRDPWRERDHAGRPVWPQRLLVMRYADLRDADASFQTIWQAVRNAPVPTPDGGRLPVMVAGQSPEDLIPTVKEHFESLAPIAAALLEGPVAIADASHLPRELRLALLDAVAALLPYGYRADLSASSSVNNTVKHQIRLVFADYPNPDQQNLSLLPQEYPPPLSDVGRRYLAALHNKRKKKGIESIVRHLWDIKDEDGRRPCSFRRPGFALAALLDLDFLGGVRDELGKSPVQPEQILRFFADPDSPAIWGRLGEPSQDNAIKSLAGAPDEAAAAILIGWWQVIRGAVLRCANRDLDAGSLEVAAWCLRLIRQADGPLEDQVLADLLVPERLKEEARDSRIAMLVELLRRRPVPAPGEYPRTCGFLRFDDPARWQERLVRELLASELSAGTPDERAFSWVAWLCRSPFQGTPNWERPEWINALDFLDSGQRREQAIPAMRAVIQGEQRAIPRGTSWSALFLHLSWRAQCLADFHEAVSWQLMELAATLPARDDGALATTLRTEMVRPVTLRTGPTAARVDVTSTLLGVTRNAALMNLDERHLAGYLAALHEAFRDGVVRPRTHELERSFLGQAISGEAGTGRLTEGGIGLLNSFADEADRRDGLASYLTELRQRAQPIDVRLSQRYWAVLSEYPALADYAVAGQLITATDWTVSHPDIAFNREDLGDGVANTRLARACYEAWCKGRRPEGIIRTLFNAGANTIPPRRLDNVLREFQDLMHRFGSRIRPDAAKESEKVLWECWRLILRGELGADYAQHFAEYLRPQLRGEIAARTHVLEMLSARNGTSRERNETRREKGKDRDQGSLIGALIHVIAWPVRTVIGKKQAPQAAGGGDAQPRGSLGKGSHADRP